MTDRSFTIDTSPAWPIDIASWAVPFDLETYVRVHFTKVADQTRLMLREYIALGSQAGLPVEALRASSSP